MNNKHIFCKVPFTIAFTTCENTYRDCCSKKPPLKSNPGEDFQDWWKGKK